GGLLVGTGHQRRTWLQRYHDSLSIAARLPYDPVAGRQRWQIAALKAAKYLPCGLCCRTFYFQLLAVVADHQAGLFRSQVLAVDVVAAASGLKPCLPLLLVAVDTASLLLAKAAFAHRILRSRKECLEVGVYLIFATIALHRQR